MLNSNSERQGHKVTPARCLSLCWGKMASRSRYVLQRVLRGLSAHTACYHSSVLRSWQRRPLWKPQVRHLSCSDTLCLSDPPTTGTVKVTSSVSDHDWIHWLCLWTGCAHIKMNVFPWSSPKKSWKRIIVIHLFLPSSSCVFTVNLQPTAPYAHHYYPLKQIIITY